MDMMADYKIKALDNMRQTVDTLSIEVDKAKKYVAQAREAETIIASSTSATTDLML